MRWAWTLFSNKKTMTRNLLIKVCFLHVIFEFRVGSVVAEVDQTIKGPGEPRHTDIVQNITVVQGRDANLNCHVENVEDYKIAWIRVKTQTILSMNDKLISRNHRFEVSTTDREEWTLRIKNVKPSDRGWYMCQINTDPMKVQTGYLEVTEPPRILTIGTSKDLTINEGFPARLTCHASGHPAPSIVWKREDGKPIPKRRVVGSTITFPSATRDDNGAYLCIASNNVPPAISRRILLNVLYAPEVQINVRLAQKPLGERVILNCTARGNPPPEIVWKRAGRRIRRGNERHRVSTRTDGSGVIFTSLEIVYLEKKDDFIQYACEASNSKGAVFDSLEIHVLDDIEFEDEEGNERNDVSYGSSPSHSERQTKTINYEEGLGKKKKKYSTTSIYKDNPFSNCLGGNGEGSDGSNNFQIHYTEEGDRIENRLENQRRRRKKKKDRSLLRGIGEASCCDKITHRALLLLSFLFILKASIFEFLSL